ncbi:MAG: hypothetical protein ACLFWD_14135, partial [Anaerolineales bacterium]
VEGHATATWPCWQCRARPPLAPSLSKSIPDEGCTQIQVEPWVKEDERRVLLALIRDATIG